MDRSEIEHERAVAEFLLSTPRRKTSVKYGTAASFATRHLGLRGLPAAKELAVALQPEAKEQPRSSLGVSIKRNMAFRQSN